MKLTARNFGPIRTATIDPSRLTVFVGPNNSGKSVMATLLHAVLLASPVGYRRLDTRRPFRGPSDVASQMDAEERERQASLIRQLIAEGRPSSGRLSHSLVELFEGHVDRTLNYFAQSIRREVERSFGSRIHELHRREAKEAGADMEILVSGSKPSWSVKVTVTGSSRPSRTEYDVTYPSNLGPVAAHAIRGLAKFFEDNPEYKPYADQDDATLLRWSLTYVMREFLAALPGTSNYLPAARSGVMQSHRALASAVVSQAPLAGLERMEVPRMAGVISDFLSTLIQLDEGTNDEELEAVAAFLEGMIMQGKIRLEERLGYPEILYAPTTKKTRTGSTALPEPSIRAMRGRSGEFRLHRTSSMISELAPLVLYLRHVVDPWSLLVIEEPESSLHPESQLRLAEAIVMIVNARVQVVITTHSDYFLNVLNNAIQAAALIEQDKDPGMRLPSISARDVAAYLFRRHPAGTTIKRLPVSERYGIAEADFLAVAEALYDTAVELDERF